MSANEIVLGDDPKGTLFSCAIAFFCQEGPTESNAALLCDEVMRALGIVEKLDPDER